MDDDAADLLNIALLVLIIILLAYWVYHERGGAPAAPVAPAAPAPKDGWFVGTEMPPDRPPCGPTPQQVLLNYAHLARLEDGLPPGAKFWQAEELDPLVLGQVYGRAFPHRTQYAERTSMDDTQGLLEYSSSGNPGDVGVDVGPPEKPGYDDGIPANWDFPSTPMAVWQPRNMVPVMQDYYDQAHSRPVPQTQGLFALYEPDHDPLM